VSAQRFSVFTHSHKNKHASILSPAWKFCFADVSLSGFKITYIFAKNRFFLFQVAQEKEKRRN